MACAAGPDVSESGLVLALDGANYKSFKGTPATNLLYSLNNTNGEVNTTDFKSSYGDEIAYIPALGYKTVRYCNIYNNYPTSGNCCPRLFDYGGNVVSKNITVSPSTTYTYEIIYKVTSGYTNANYMYRYEYNGGTYVTEAGVHSDANRTSLGDGWYHAWGQFTTQVTTNNLWLTGMWYYQYAVYDKVSVASVSLHQGTYIIPPEHMLLPQENRGTTVATGGGWADMTGRSNNGELVNGPTYNSANGGSLVFDGVDDGVNIPHNSNIDIRNQITMECLFYLNSFTAGGPNSDRITLITKSYSYYMTINLSGKIDTYFYGTGGYFSSNSSVNLNQWTHVVVTFNGSTINWYINGIIDKSLSQSGTITPERNGDLGIGREVFENYGRGMNGRISNAKLYNRALTAQEIQQNFNATRSRFGI